MNESIGMVALKLAPLVLLAWLALVIHRMGLAAMLRNVSGFFLAAAYVVEHWQEWFRECVEHVQFGQRRTQ